jgi:hypothetical protein
MIDTAVKRMMLAMTLFLAGCGSGTGFRERDKVMKCGMIP